MLIELNDPDDRAIEQAADAYVLSPIAFSKIPVKNWSLRGEAESSQNPLSGSSVDASLICLPPMQMRIARLLIEYLEDNVGLLCDITTQADTVSLVLSADSSSYIVPNSILPSWYIKWHASTSLIDPTIRDLVLEFLTLSKDTQLIFRGEPKEYAEVSSTLWRLYGFDDTLLIEAMVDALLQVARRYEAIQNDMELQALVQHFGGRTNLIDFSSSIWVALYFACCQHEHQDGRILALNTSVTGDFQICSNVSLPTVQKRMDVQHSVMVSTMTGVLKEDIILPTKVRSEVKRALLSYLGDVHRIQFESIYPDIHGFINAQETGDGYPYSAAPMVLSRLGKAMRDRGRWQEAVTYYERAQLADPVPFFTGQVESAKALVFAQLGRYDEALEFADRAISMFGSLTGEHPGFAHLLRAWLLNQGGRTAETRAAALEAHRCLPPESDLRERFFRGSPRFRSE